MNIDCLWMDLWITLWITYVYVNKSVDKSCLSVDNSVDKPVDNLWTVLDIKTCTGLFFIPNQKNLQKFNIFCKSLIYIAFWRVSYCIKLYATVTSLHSGVT